MSNKPLVVHNDGSIYLIEKLDKDYKVEDELNRYANLIEVPANVHTYFLDDYSLWSSAAMGIKADEIINFLNINSKNIIPKQVENKIKKAIKEFWTMELYIEENIIKLKGIKEAVNEILKSKNIQKRVIKKEKDTLTFNKEDFYDIRSYLLDHNVYLKEMCSEFDTCSLKINSDIILHGYQEKAVERFIQEKPNKSDGRGVIIMPPGSGKTLVGLKIIEQLGVSTLIILKDNKKAKMGNITTWIEEIKDKTNLSEKDISINSIEEGKSICICTYQYAANNICSSDLKDRWGLIIYDNANNLPAKQASKTAYIPSKYKLAMDSILARSDNNETLIFKTIGPKISNLTLKKLEQDLYQIKVKCIEVKIPFVEPWDTKEEGKEIHTASKNIKKIEAFQLIDEYHGTKRKVLVSYFRKVSDKFNNILKIPLCDGKSNGNIREELITNFNEKKLSSMIFTEIIEKSTLKEIDVLVSLSYNGESEREEYLRVGKLKGSNEWSEKVGYYYALVSKGTEEEKVYNERRNKMIKHGYEFYIKTLDDLRGDKNESF